VTLAYLPLVHTWQCQNLSHWLRLGPSPTLPKPNAVVRGWDALIGLALYHISSLAPRMGMAPPKPHGLRQAARQRESLTDIQTFVFKRRTIPQNELISTKDPASLNA
jgi:hypothetical protein